ncbi:EamA-like transporter family protein [compost metagenome]
MEPVFAALTGVIFGGENLTLAAIIGCVCIFAGMILTVEFKKVRFSAPRKLDKARD